MMFTSFTFGVPTGRAMAASQLGERFAGLRSGAVMLRVDDGSARFTLRPPAESAGGRGDTIRLRNPESRRVFTARVESKARAVVASR